MQPEVPEGIDVHTFHLRRFSGLHNAYTRRAVGRDRKPEPKGGETVVKLERGNPKTGEGYEFLAEGRAWCSSRDNYSKRVGRMIATGRALKKLGLA